MMTLENKINLKRATKPELVHAPEGVIDAFLDRKNGWVVQIYGRESELLRHVQKTPWSDALVMAVTHNVAANWGEWKGGGVEVSWDELQFVKCELFPDAVGLEVYPPKDQLVDVAMMRWLLILPNGIRFPFNLNRAGGPLISLVH